MIEGFEHLQESCENHPKDRHVLAAAIHGKAETIVTFNVRDFGPSALAPWGIHVAHPSEYLRVLFDHDEAAVINALHEMALKAQRTVPELLGRLAWHVRPFCEHVSAELDLELLEIPPQTWRRT